MLAGIASAQAITPLDYLHGDGDKAYPVVKLTWALMSVAGVVIAIIGLLVCLAIWKRPGITNTAPGESLEVRRPGGGMPWIWWGSSLTMVVLLASIFWTVKVLGQIRPPRTADPLTVQVTAHQWWWELRYLNKDSSQIFTTANEIHIPTGRPVFFLLNSRDVIHSFWVPALSGKTDAIPGLTNETWMEANSPGVYRGQCTEYCGPQHAKMGLIVVAQSPAEFEAWRADQLRPAKAPSGAAAAGAVAFNAHCAGCHAISGTGAAGIAGPDLSHLMLRRTLAAGMIPNEPQALARWISDPQSIKPGSLMPKPAADSAAFANIRAYLTTLN